MDFLIPNELIPLLFLAAGLIGWLVGKWGAGGDGRQF